jgi:hypothetical protein
VKTTNTEKFCQAMLSLGINSAKPLANLVMALASFKEAHSVVELSKSPFYHYQYSSICDGIHGLCSTEKDHDQVSKLLRQFWLETYPCSDGIYRFTSDTTPINKPHSPTLSHRSYIHVSNTIIDGNKPLGIGFRLSTLTLSGLLNWQLPLSMARVRNDETASKRLLEQLSTLFEDRQLPFENAPLVINRLDRAYGNAAYLSPAYQYANLVNITRFRNGQKIWRKNIRTKTGGRNAIYDPDPYYLIAESRTKSFRKKEMLYQKYQPSIFELEADEVAQIGQISPSGRRMILELSIWKNVLLRSKNGHTMSDKPLDIVCVKTLDAFTKAPIFQEVLFIGICGEKKDSLPLNETVSEYQQRYGIEPFFRFDKQNLFLESFKTPDIQHLDNWFLIVQMTNWLLYQVAQEAKQVSPKWQQYLPKEQIENPIILSLAQAQKAAQSLFITFDTKPFLPQKCKKGKPRQKGQIQVPRNRYEVFRKKKKTPD